MGATSSVFGASRSQELVFRLVHGEDVSVTHEPDGAVGFRLWPAALALARYLEQHVLDENPRITAASQTQAAAAAAEQQTAVSTAGDSTCSYRPALLELGCGVTLLPALVAASLGCDPVLASDRLEVIQYCRDNLLGGTGVRPVRGVACDWVTLTMVRATILAALRASAGTVVEAAQQVDVENVEKIRLDYIVMADVVYFPSGFRPLLEVLRLLCKECRASGRGAGVVEQDPSTTTARSSPAGESSPGGRSPPAGGSSPRGGTSPPGGVGTDEISLDVATSPTSGVSASPPRTAAAQQSSPGTEIVGAGAQQEDDQTGEQPTGAPPQTTPRYGPTDDKPKNSNGAPPTIYWANSTRFAQYTPDLEEFLRLATEEFGFQVDLLEAVSQEQLSKCLLLLSETSDEFVVPGYVVQKERGEGGVERTDSCDGAEKEAGGGLFSSGTAGMEARSAGQSGSRAA